MNENVLIKYWLILRGLFDNDLRNWFGKLLDPIKKNIYIINTHHRTFCAIIKNVFYERTFCLAVSAAENV